MHMKQFFFALLTAAPLTCATAAQTPPSCAIPGTNNDFLGIQTIRLWPGSAPKDC